MIPSSRPWTSGIVPRGTRAAHPPLRRGAMLAAVMAASLSLACSSAEAARWNWSGSGVLDYMRVFRAPVVGPLGKLGANVEWSLKATVELSEKSTVNARLCTSCHGLTVDQAYAEVHAVPHVNFEVGRINVPFGDFYLRHDPASDAFLSKPLPYAMGHMLRYQADRFNLGVVPMPYVDNGVSLFGDVWIRDALQIWYGVYGVNGFRSQVPRDFNFMDQVSTDGFNDNNNSPSWGGRLALARGAWALGGSYLFGAYDPASAYDYDVWGLDASVQVRTVRLRGEYLARSTDVADGSRHATLKKKGFLAQVEAPVRKTLVLVGRLDGLVREGPALGTSNDESTGIVRFTLGANLSPAPDYAIRVQHEYWRFTDHREENVLHAGVVLTY